MIILNTTFYVHQSIDAQFRRWIDETYFPSALTEGNLSNPLFAKLLLEPQDGMSGYAVQVMAYTPEEAATWHDGVGGELRNDLMARFGQNILFFTTYMESIESNDD